MNKLIITAIAALFAAGAQAADPVATKPAAAPAAAPAKADATKPAIAPVAPVAPVAKPAPGSPVVTKPHPGAACQDKAVGSDGKPLHGAAKGAFMKKCMAGMPKPETKPMPKPLPETKPMPKPDAKPMPGPAGKQPSPAQQAQRDKMKACAAEGKGKKGPEHKNFMKECLSK